MEIAWEDTPPPKAVRRIIVVRPGNSIRALILGEPLGVWIHWVGKRSQPCQGVGRCAKCREDNPRMWRAYLPAAYREFIRRGSVGNDPIGEWSPKIIEGALELTEAHGEFISGGDLRGVVIECHKPKGDRKSLRIIRAGFDENPPPAFDVKPILFRLWGIGREDTKGPRIAEEA